MNDRHMTGERNIARTTGGQMSWLLLFYPARWRQRYEEEFRAVLSTQPGSVGLFFDVVAGAIDAHLHPQIQLADSDRIQGENNMTLAMFRRCALGGPKLSPEDRRIARRVMLWSALVIAAFMIGLAKMYRGASGVQALIYWSGPALGLIYEQTAYLRKRSPLTQGFILGGGLLGMYSFIWGATLVGERL
jgi:hypothetical protein